MKKLRKLSKKKKAMFERVMTKNYRAFLSKMLPEKAALIEHLEIRIKE